MVLYKISKIFNCGEAKTMLVRESYLKFKKNLVKGAFKYALVIPIAFTIIFIFCMIVCKGNFDAKETTSKTSFPLTNIHPHQLTHIRRVIKHQGITFLIIKMCATYFLFPGWDLIDFVDNNTRKSIPLEYIKEKSYVIKEGFIPPLDYIKALDLLIKEKTKNDKEIY